MIKITYKPGKEISSTKNKNNYYQPSDQWSDDLWYKGYRKNDNFIGYSECYMVWRNKGIKYII
jgi:hypothetical protein